MKKFFFSFLYLLLVINISAQETRQLSVAKPQAIADLKTEAGAALVGAKWFVQPAHIVEANFKLPGASASDLMLLYQQARPSKQIPFIPR